MSDLFDQKNRILVSNWNENKMAYANRFRGLRWLIAVFIAFAMLVIWPIGSHAQIQKRSATGSNRLQRYKGNRSRNRIPLGDPITYDDLQQWLRFKDNFGPNLTGDFSTKGAIRKITGQGTPLPGFDINNDTAVQNRAQEILTGLGILIRENPSYRLKFFNIIRMTGGVRVAFVQPIVPGGAQIFPLHMGLVAIKFNSTGSLIDFESFYVSEIEIMNEGIPAIENMALAEAQTMFTLKEGSSFPSSHIQKHEYAPFVELAEPNNFDRALFFIARRFTVDYNGRTYTQWVADDNCIRYFLSPSNYRRQIQQKKFPLISGSIQGPLLNSILKNNPPLPQHQASLEDMVRDGLRQLRNQPISGTLLRFGDMSKFTEVNHTVSYRGDEIHFTLDWQINDLIREKIINEVVCDCRLAIKIRVKVLGSGRLVDISVLPVTAYQISIGVPSTCVLTQLAVVIAAIYNYIDPIVITPAIQLFGAELKSPLIDPTIAQIVANLPNSEGADYFGNPKIYQFDFSPQGSTVTISYDLKQYFGGGIRWWECWTSIPFQGSHSNFYVDVTGDGKADAVSIALSGQLNSVKVRPSTGVRFAAEQKWTVDSEFYKSREIAFGDIDGDRVADLISVRDTGIVGFITQNRDFQPPILLTIDKFRGDISTAFADVNGDKMVDAIAVNASGIVVRLSNGSSFGPPTPWTPGPFVEPRGNYFADVDGDGMADSILANAGGVFVRRSTGSTFGRIEAWLAEALDTDHRILVGNFNGDKLADLFMQPGQSKHAYVVLSNGTEFVRQLPDWPYGWGSSWKLYLADVDNDKRSELISPTINGTQVMRDPLASRSRRSRSMSLVKAKNH